MGVLVSAQPSATSVSNCRDNGEIILLFPRLGSEHKMKLLGRKKYPQDFSQNNYESDFNMKVLLLSPPPSYSAHP